MQWMLEPDVFNGDLQPFIDTLKSFNIKHTICQFGKSYEDHIDEIEGGHVYFIGSLQFAKKAKEKRVNWRGLFYNPDKLNCTYYYPRFDEFLLNRPYFLLPFGELKFLNFDYLANVFDAEGVFIRPNDTDKSFTGLVLTRENWNNRLSLLSRRVNPEELVLLSGQQEIIKEWRLIIIDGKVIAGSQYKENGNNVRISDVPTEVYVFADEVLSKVKYNPDPAWMLDICHTNSTWPSLKVLEVGSFSCSGLYAADPVSIINTLEKRN